MSKKITLMMLQKMEDVFKNTILEDDADEQNLKDVQTAIKWVKGQQLPMHDVVEPKGTFICKLCSEEMEVGEQCSYENMSYPNYTGK